MNTKSDHFLVYSLIGLFCALVFIFLGVAFYADVWYPREFNQKFCIQQYVEKDFSVDDLLKEWSTSRVNKHQIFIRRLDPRGEKKPLDTTAGQNLVQSIVSSGEKYMVGAELGLLQLDTCEVTYQDGRIQKVYFEPDETDDDEP